MKQCSKCKIVKYDFDFGPRKASKDGKQSWCKQCFKEYNAQKDYSDSSKRYKKKKERLKKHQEWMLQYLSENHCVDCGETDVVVLKFDHVGKKEHNISNMLADGHSLENIQKEIKKCDVVCANCHKRRTYRRCNSYRTQ